jgi:hypothetical protein
VERRFTHGYRKARLIDLATVSDVALGLGWQCARTAVQTRHCQLHPRLGRYRAGVDTCEKLVLYLFLLLATSNVLVPGWRNW